MEKEMDGSKLNLNEEDLEKIAAGAGYDYKKYTRKYPVTKQEAHKIRMGAKKCRSQNVSYGEYRAYMWHTIKPQIDYDRRNGYEDRVFFAGDPDAFLAYDIDGGTFNILIDDFWKEFGGVIDLSQC